MRDFIAPRQTVVCRHPVCEADAQITGLHQDPSAWHLQVGIRDDAWYTANITQNSTTNTNVFKMADYVQGK